MKRRTYSVFLAIVLSALAATAQQDSLLLHPEALGTDDILTPVKSGKENVQIISGSRFPVSAADLPFSVYVIDKEEIRQNAYETLVDALKMVPGIRVSQPGSAIEGETFLMRGLLGNTYTKILINDVPIKPAFVAGMPIGAQLPIKEAERIEVIYGAGAALYGADASAGVINIITRQSEKPVFMQADLSVGQGLYSSVNVMFGGKLGRDKHIFKYFVYASNMLLERRNIFYDLDYNYNPHSYPGLSGQDTSYVFLPNYAGTSASEPLLTNTPHLSRKFGMTLNYRRMTLSVQSMYRRDHSSLGLNPVAVSYRNPLNYIGEGIWHINLNLAKTQTNRNRKTDFTYFRYRLDDRSSMLYVFNKYAGEIYRASFARAKADFPNNVEEKGQEIFLRSYNRLLDGQRYMFSESDEFRMEHVRNYRLFKRMTLTAGFSGRFAGGYPFTEFLSRPIQEEGDLVINPGFTSFDTLTFPLQPELKYYFEGNTYGQLFYNGKKFNLTAGINAATYALGDTVSFNSFEKLSPRLAGIWNLTPGINIRTAWGKAFRIPSEYFKSTTYFFTSAEPDNIQRRSELTTAESTTSWETGIRLKSGNKADVDFTWFSNETSNLINYHKIGGFGVDSTKYAALLGYANLQNSSIRFSGGQFSFNLQTTNMGKKLADFQFKFSWIKAKLKLQDSKELVSLPQYSGRLTQIRAIIYPLKKTTFILDYLRTKDLGRTAGPKPKNKYSTLDLVARYALTDRFDVYVKIINVFDKKYSGIPASRTPDDLIYNPQAGFFMRVGMNYFLD